jgi:nicotinamidase-related amidase
MTRALIVIDVQESFRQHPGWATISNPGSVGQVNQLVDETPAGRGSAEILADPRPLQVEDVVARTEYALAGRFATIATVADLADLAIAAGTADG